MLMLSLRYSGMKWFLFFVGAAFQSRLLGADCRGWEAATTRKIATSSDALIQPPAAFQ
jgi:hypothetical protein